MDKSWINIKDRVNNEAFKHGLQNFLEFSHRSKSAQDKIKCPCTRCRNSRSHARDDVYSHVIINGFLEGYTNWVYQGEEPHYQKKKAVDVPQERKEHDDLEGLIHDGLFSSYHHADFQENIGNSNTHSEVPREETETIETHFDENTEKFFKLLKHAECELFSGCKTFSTLSFIVRLLHVKTLCRWSNKSFTMLMEVLNEAFHDNEMFPKSYREAWNIIKELGLEYKKFHACPNDCMLYWKEAENDEACKHCKTSRYKPFEVHDECSTKRKQRIPAKVVRYFPLKPRLQRLFMSSKTSHLMRWHAEGRTINDDKVRHPAGSRVWGSFDEKYPDFAADCRNVRLGLATDGFNPFKSMTLSHSTWPVVLIPYNLPPGRCMKQPSMILSTLIDGPRSPGNDIDVYLQPLIEELQDLWFNGVPTYDATDKCMFQMRAALFWTINDFPAYAMVSGWSTKGAFACPCCNKNCRSLWLKNGRKHCYMGSRRFLPSGHKDRKDKIHFDGSVEKAPKPKRLSGSEILEQVDGMVNSFGKHAGQNSRNKRKRKDEQDHTSQPRYNWKKKSIFFQLPYWKENLLPHNLDIMHIEKNVLENILWTLLGVNSKTKDNLNSRLDLQELGIRKPLHPQREGNKVHLPPACFTMSKKEKDIFLQVLKSVKVPDGYASNISKCVNLAERNIFGLKSHDCHILMQQLLPVALRRTVPKHVGKAITGLCDIFKQLYSKVHSISDYDHLEERVALVLCELEKIFPPSFFDVMVHLPIHLPEEAKLAGPVQFRSMYPIERYLCGLKNYVRTRSHPEGSIAEGYLAEECMTFCSMYLNDVESKLNRPNRNDEKIERSLSQGGRHLGREEVFMLNETEWIQAHRYVLNSLSIVDDFKTKHLKELQGRSRSLTYQKQVHHAETFHDWFKKHVKESSGVNVEQDISKLAAGPSKFARRYTGYVVNGLRFHTKQREMRRKTQNSGVFLTASTNSFSSSKDKNPKSGDVSYYGVLQDIIELRYTNDLKFVLFKCDWVDYNVGLRRDNDYNLTLVNFNHLLYRGNRIVDEPFILASQAQQAWYIQDPVDRDWHVALEMSPRTIFNVDPEVNEFESNEDERIFSRDEDETGTNTGSISWAREDVDRVTLIVDVDTVGQGNGSENDDVDLEVTDDEAEDITSDKPDSSDDDDDDFFEERAPLNNNENE